MRWYSQLRFSRTSIIICWLISILAGLGLARLMIPSSGIAVVVGFIVACLIAKNKNLITIICIVVFGVLIGLWRGQFYMHKLAVYQELLRHQVTIVGSVDSNSIYDKSQLSFDLVNLKVVSPIKTNMVGKIGIKGFGENAIYRGDEVQISGKLYPTRGSRQATISFAQIKVLKRSSSVINSLRRKFEASMYTTLPEPQASFALGLLIGQRNTLPKTITNQLSTAGLTHIVAVSGYNLTIIISAVYFLLKRLSKYQATLGSVFLIILFIVFTGTSASIIRAAIVSLLALLAGYYGRTFKPMVLILLAAAMTAYWSPTYLWSDIGWYLSFLAFYGVLVLAPLITQRIFGKKEPRLLMGILLETMAAQLMALPIIMFIFGQVSLIALPANMIVIPLVPLAMVLSFVAAVSGMLIPSLAGWSALPARIILTYMLDMIGLVTKVPHAMSLRSLNLLQVIIIYVLIVLISWFLWFKNKSKYGTITDIDE